MRRCNWQLAPIYLWSVRLARSAKGMRWGKRQVASIVWRSVLRARSAKRMRWDKRQVASIICRQVRLARCANGMRRDNRQVKLSELRLLLVERRSARQTISHGTFSVGVRARQSVAWSSAKPSASKPIAQSGRTH